jgi:tRNA(Ile)-lysidine synthase
VTGLLERIKQHLATHRLLKRNERVVVAVSCGVDSMALLHALHALAPDFGWQLSVAHFNHRLRGRSSDADERLVRATAKRLKLRCDVSSADVRKAAKEQGVSVEMAARQSRHDFLARCARKRGARVVALAHHADDQVELFLLRLLRGAGGEGLGGMKARGASPVDKRVALVRPMLEFSKDEIAAFAREARIRFREDASNASPEFERNWVRLELLPLLRKRRAAITQTILRVMEIAGAEAEFVNRVAEAWLKRDSTAPSSGLRPPSPHRMGRDSMDEKHSQFMSPNRSRRREEADSPVASQSASSRRRLRGGSWAGQGEGPFDAFHMAVQRRVIQMQLHELGVAADFQLVEALRKQPGRKVTIGPGVELICDARGRVRRAAADAVDFGSDERRLALPGDWLKPGPRAGAVNFAGLRLRWRLLRRMKNLAPERAAGREFFDADKAGARLVLRHWRAGDRFQPIGLRAATKLQDWFTNRKVPASRRRQLVLAETERGEVFWVEGERIGEACKVTSATRRVLELRWKRL